MNSTAPSGFQTPWISDVTYNAASQPTAIATTNPQVYPETRVYNALGQLTSLTNGYRFEYDFSATQNDGRITAQRTYAGSALQESISYGYDSLNRLSSANGGSWSAGYGYDGFGNLLTVTPSGAGPSSMNVTVSPATNQVNGWIYDANGNVTAQSGFTGVYDIENRLLEATKNSSILYGYGADNRRIFGSKPLKLGGGTTITDRLGSVRQSARITSRMGRRTRARRRGIRRSTPLTSTTRLRI